MDALMDSVTFSMAYTSRATFAAIARAIQAECALQGLRCPAFRSPPRAPGPRTIRHLPESVVVAVRLDRDPNRIAGDMIDGAVFANADLLALEPGAEELIRAALWTAAGLAVV